MLFVSFNKYVLQVKLKKLLTNKRTLAVSTAALKRRIRFDLWRKF